MSRPLIHGRYRTVPASKLLQKLGESLEMIRQEDDLSYQELGGELHKSDDQASKYCKATADMPVSTFLKGVERWDGRFANATLAMLGMKLVPLDGAALPDRKAMTIVMRAQAAMSENLEDDDSISDEELVEDRAWVEAAGAVFDGWRLRLAEIDRKRD